MSSRRTSLAGRFRRLDPLLVVTGLVALAVYVPHGFQGMLSRDLGLYVYGGQQFAEGVPPFVAVLSRTGPLAHVLPGIGVAVSRFAGVDDVVGTRMLFMVFAIACVMAAYLLARQVFSSRLAGLAASASLLALQGFTEYATHGPREKTPTVLFGYLALWAVLHRYWLTTGVFIGLATLTWQPAFVALIVVAAVAALLLETGHRFRALLRIVAGGLAQLAVTLVYYVAVGHVRTFLDAFLLINARYTSQPSLADRPLPAWENLVAGYGWSVWVMLAGLLATLLLAGASARAIVRVSANPWADRVLVAVGSGTIAALAWSYYIFNGWPDAFFLFPMVTMGLGGAIARLARWLPQPTVAVVVPVLLVVALVVTAAVDSARGKEDRLVAQRASTAAVLDRVGSDASLLSVQSPQALVLAQRTNPTRHQMFTGGLTDYIDDTWPGGIAGYARWIAGEAPTVLAVKGANPWLQETLDEHYRPSGRAPGWRWYLHESVPKTVVRDVRGATRRVLRRMKRSAS